jgi:hypothetical protein
MTDPNIILGIRQPEPVNPLATIGSLMQIREGQARMALQSQQMQTSQAEQQNYQAQADQKRRELTDSNTEQQLYKDGGLDFAKSVAAWDGKPGTPFPLDGKVSPAYANARKTQLLTQQKDALANTDEQNKQNAVKFDHIERTLKSLLYDPADPSKPAEDSYVTQNAALAFQQLVKDGDLKPENVPNVQSADTIRQFAQVTGHGAGLTAYAQANAKAKQEVSTGASTEAMNLAHADQFKADAAKFDQDVITAKANLPKIEADAKIAGLESAFRAAHGGQSVTDVETAKRDSATAANQRGELGLKQKEFDAKYGDPSSRAAFLESVKRDPDSYFSLSPEMKVGVARDLVSQGLNVPVQIPGDLKTRAVSAGLTLKAIERVKDLLADPDIKNSIGPIAGRLGNIEQNVGDTFFGESDPRARKEQELRTQLAYLKFQESKGLFGGRPAAQLLTALSSTTANTHMTSNLINGSLDAMTDTMKRVGQEARDYSGGGAAGGVTGNPGAVSADVKAALANVGPGVHTLSDGSRWMTAADGSITPAPPKK